MTPEELERERQYAQLFTRAMKDPMSVTNEDLGRLTPEDRHLFVVRCEVESELIENELRRRCGMPPLPLSHRVSKARIAELRNAMKRPGCSVLDIPQDEWLALCAGGQLGEVVG